MGLSDCKGFSFREASRIFLKKHAWRRQSDALGYRERMGRTHRPQVSMSRHESFESPSLCRLVYDFLRQRSLDFGPKRLPPCRCDDSSLRVRSCGSLAGGTYTGPVGSAPKWVRKVDSRSLTAARLQNQRPLGWSFIWHESIEISWLHPELRKPTRSMLG